jgi:hypothetical protein
MEAAAPTPGLESLWRGKGGGEGRANLLGGRAGSLQRGKSGRCASPARAAHPPRPRARPPRRSRDRLGRARGAPAGARGHSARKHPGRAGFPRAASDPPGRAGPDRPALSPPHEPAGHRPGGVDDRLDRGAGPAHDPEHPGAAHARARRRRPARPMSRARKPRRRCSAPPAGPRSGRRPRRALWGRGCGRVGRGLAARWAVPRDSETCPECGQIAKPVKSAGR